MSSEKLAVCPKFLGSCRDYSMAMPEGRIPYIHSLIEKSVNDIEEAVLAVMAAGIPEGCISLTKHRGRGELPVVEISFTTQQVYS